ncbi:MAG: carbohydrate-binding domain-containing protein [Ruminococcus sp.]|nr:carbohydrate-binding domain-containing protein [Ruminococcus sp.]
MRKKVMALTAALILAITSFASCSKSSSADGSSQEASSIVASDIDMKIDASDLEVGYDESSACRITLDGTSASVSGDGAAWKDGVLTISKAGTYILSGKLTSGRVLVDAGKNDDVHIVLAEAEITSSDNTAMTVLQADKVSITLEENSVNKFTDGSEYKTSGDEANADACIFSKADLTINGSGSLEVNGNYKHGVLSKDDLVITGGKLTVTSKSTAVSGKDSVRISGGEFDISAGTNGIKSDNSEDSTKGFISITGGSFKIVSNNDAIEAQSVLKTDGGTFDITTGGGSKNASTKQDGKPNGDWQKNMNDGGGGMRGGRMKERMQGEDGMQQGGQMPDGQTPPDMQDKGGFGGRQMPGNAGDVQPAAAVNEQPVVTPTADSSSEESSTSAKALKAGSDLEITGGTFGIDSADDAVHSNGRVNITGGKLEISSGDDGIHADKDLIISGGEVNISKSYEGIEGMTATISGGTVNVTASDDGINCAGGSDTGSQDRAGRNMFASQEGVYLKITGGNVTVNSNGDGLDSNGDLLVEGGTTVVYGPTNSGNGALDYNGKATITGGSVIALGAVGMEQNFSEGSTQCSVLADFDRTVDADTELTIKDSSGKTVFTAKNAKTWQGVVFSSADIKQGQTYTLTAGSSTKTVEVTSTVTGGSNGGQMGGRGGKMNQ